ncbi:MAG: succinate--CoA ligase subunit alpha [Dehalococcoidia bacterium]
MSILVDQATRILVLGITGREAVSFTKDILDYGGRVVAGVTPGRGGRDVHGVPVYDTVAQVLGEHEVDAVVLAVPAPAVRDAAFECIAYGIPLMVIVTERVPRWDVAQVVEFAQGRDVRMIGPNSMGLISPGKTKVGSVGGPAEDTRKSFPPGKVGIMSRSGGMTTEIANLLAQHGLGVSTAVSIGGDPIVGSTFADLLPLFEEDPETEAVVTFSEPGGAMEAELAELIEARGTRLRVVSFIAGDFMAEMPGVRFGHAGSMVNAYADSAAAKAALLRSAGVLVADQFSDIPDLVRA